MLLTLQYLDARPGMADLPVADVARRLRTALEIVPVSHVLIGWAIPAALRDACRQEAARANARFLRWQPLLTGDGALPLRPEWRTVGVAGERIRGWRDLDEFTFACPNHPAARVAILDHLADLLDSGLYDGVFLDRIRFPSPARNPVTDLGCFCEACVAAAAAKDFDLVGAQRRLVSLAATDAGRTALVRCLLGDTPEDLDDMARHALDGVLRFREATITSFVREACKPLRTAGLEAGLDCFSPCLARSVGQDLRALGETGDWIKVMSYGRALGPAGLPFELAGLAGYLVEAAGRTEADALAILARATGLSLPRTLEALRRHGLTAEEVGREVRRGVAATPGALLAGLEAVDIAGVCETSPERLQQDLLAVQTAQPAGLSISWDLMDIPERNLRALRSSWQS